MLKSVLSAGCLIFCVHAQAESAGSSLPDCAGKTLIYEFGFKCVDSDRARRSSYQDDPDFSSYVEVNTGEPRIIGVARTESMAPDERDDRILVNWYLLTKMAPFCFMDVSVKVGAGAEPLIGDKADNYTKCGSASLYTSAFVQFEAFRQSGACLVPSADWAAISASIKPTDDRPSDFPPCRAAVKVDYLSSGHPLRDSR